MNLIRKIVVVVVLLMVSYSIKAQNVLDRAYIKEHNLNRKPVPYTYLREADVMWHRRIWRIIDLREKMNHPLYFPIDDKMKDRNSLFEIIKKALLPPDGSPPKLAAYLPAPAGDDEFTIKMNALEVQDKLMKRDTSYVPSDPTDPSSPMVATPTVDDVGSGKVVKYYIKEDWFFDKQRSVLEARIIGIQPITAKTNEKGEVVGDAGTFWIYFPELRPLLAKEEVFNKHNDAERLTFDDLFWKRMFSSYIQKESNVYDRFIREYKTDTLDQLLEAEKIKDNVFTLEHDLWHL